MIGYTISSILWAMGGLIVGFLLGRGGQTVRSVEVASDDVTTPAVHRFRDSLTFDRIVGWVIIVMAILSVATVSYAVTRQQQAVICQADYNAAFSAALKERNDAAAADRQAIRDLLTGMVTARDPVTSRALIDTYLRKLDEADNKRDDNPLPQRPAC